MLNDPILMIFISKLAGEPKEVMLKIILLPVLQQQNLEF